jgi:hypothetical protein
VVLIVGIAATAAGAVVLHDHMRNGDFGDPGDVIRMVRRTTGVVLAVANFIRAALDALQLINRPAPAGASGSGGYRRIGGIAED